MEPIVAPQNLFVDEAPRRVYVPERLMTFEQFLDAYGEDDEVELIDGVAVEKMSAQLEHESLYHWIVMTLGVFIKETNAGIFLGSRTPVRINNHRGRLPDLLFVAAVRRGIVQQKAIYGAPDMIIEIVSPYDRPSDIASLETDYRAIGVGEIVFLDQRKLTVRTLHRDTATGDYSDVTATAGDLVFAAVPGFQVPVVALWQSPQPSPFSVLLPLLQPAPPSDTV